jgi:hypothetical protein
VLHNDSCEMFEEAIVSRKRLLQKFAVPKSDSCGWNAGLFAGAVGNEFNPQRHGGIPWLRFTGIGFWSDFAPGSACGVMRSCRTHGH